MLLKLSGRCRFLFCCKTFFMHTNCSYMMCSTLPNVVFKIIFLNNSTASYEIVNSFLNFSLVALSCRLIVVKFAIVLFVDSFQLDIQNIWKDTRYQEIGDIFTYKNTFSQKLNIYRENSRWTFKNYIALKMWPLISLKLA